MSIDIDTPYKISCSTYRVNYPNIFFIIKMFKIIGAADAAANLLCEFKIAEKNEAKLIKKIKGNVIFVS